MPVKSKAQFRKFQAMHKRGEISKATLDEWLKGVDFKRLPERASKPKRAGKKKKKKLRKQKHKKK